MNEPSRVASNADASSTVASSTATASTATASTADAVEHLDVLIIGAGLSGIGAAHHLQTDSPWASYAVLEARDSIGGTWDLFRYPGNRSDSDMFTLGFPFRPWRGENAIAAGGDILQYIKDTAAEAGIDRKIRFGHRVLSADYSSADARWTVVAERMDSSAEVADGSPAPVTEAASPAAPPALVTFTCDFVFSCSGYYRYDHGYLPEFKGTDSYKGQIIHPQFWPTDLDYSGKSVIVIGSGATAMTLVPSMAPQASHVTMLQRSPTYVLALPAKNPAANMIRKVLPEKMSGPIVRWMLALGTLTLYQVSQRRPKAVKKMIRKQLESVLPPGYDIDTHFTPKYDPWDQRLCVVPDGDLFTAISDGTVEVVTDKIAEFTPKGIRLESGAELEADIIVTATGLEMLFIGGIELSLDGEAVDPSEHLTYKGMMLEGVPNFAVAFGYTNASWTLKADLTSEYVCRLLNHMRESGWDTCTAVNTESQPESLPLLGLTSGYVQRAAGRFPKQGTKFPWQVHQNYLRDYRAMKMRPVVDDAMRFSKAQDDDGRVVVRDLAGSAIRN
ncbi:MAG TPA: NAD(P)/FAD-dependent oxidoreductase [Microthrixaceae bacterium]|nr:NAD(P)/FAD-dependent oxidoreductase [Microthrixaceae bacterium]